MLIPSNYCKKVRLCRRRLCFRFVDHFCKLRFAGCIFCRDKNSASIYSTGIQAVFALNIFKKRLPANRLFCFLLVSLSERDFIPVYRAEKRCSSICRSPSWFWGWLYSTLPTPENSLQFFIFPSSNRVRMFSYGHGCSFFNLISVKSIMKEKRKEQPKDKNYL